MAPRRHAHHRRAGNGPLLIALGIVLIAVVGGGLLLHSAGVINLPFLSGGKDDGPTEPDNTGKIALVMPIRPLEAYSSVERTDIVNPRTRQYYTVWLYPEQIHEDALKTPREVLGRVLRRDKPPNEYFVKADFYPKGTRAGPTAGVPAGKRAMQLKASAVPGLHGLRRGDAFDIVMTVEVEVEDPRSKPRRRDELEIEGPYGPLANAEAAPAEGPVVKRRRAEVRLIVENGLVVKPVFQRHEVTEKGSLLRGTQIQQKPIEELIIAVNPKEVAELNRALAIGANLQVAMRSGQIAPEGESVEDGRIPDISIDIAKPQPDADAAEPATKRPRVRIVEVIVGGKKRLMAVPETDGSDAPAPDEDDGK